MRQLPRDTSYEIMEPPPRVHCDHSAPARYVDAAVDVVRQAVEPRYYYEPAPPRQAAPRQEAPPGPALIAAALAVLLLIIAMFWGIGVYEDRQFARCATRTTLPEIPAEVTDACYREAFRSVHGRKSMP